ncbi:hypothetical protein PQZ67_gp13 [Escherichia phage ZCEC13]|uniref:Uncharacterized protein n=1 Tax=Escherichia phage ZCEC13 TaxID=2935866 RepID=A0AAE9HHJ1_9CAUD|nr:hypothetical protein PQZ67_gp13 [Escherichia phage ZCEC13]UPU16165.1 hypothetical protein [Escherichia phage ZCEC13]
MDITKGVLIILLAGWVIIVTIATVPLELEYKWQAWTIVAFGPVAVISGLWEVLNRVFRGRGK